MNRFERQQRFNRMKQMVELKQAGKPDLLANKFQVSVRTIYRDLSLIREEFLEDGYRLDFNPFADRYEKRPL